MEKNRDYKFDVFLSFAGSDSEFAKPIWKKFEENGIKVFFADESLKENIGHPVDDEIVEAMHQSEHFVLVCTPAARESEWVKDEYNYFYHQIYKKSKKKRRFIILEGKGFGRELVPGLMKLLKTAKSADEIIRLIKGEKKRHPLTKTTKVETRSIAKQVVLAMLIIAVLTIAAFYIPNFINKRTGQNPGIFYAVNLPFMDDRHQSPIKPEVEELLNQAVIRGMNSAKKAMGNLYINEPDHQAQNVNKCAQDLVRIVFNQYSPVGHRVDMIINQIMVPNKIDIIVSGRYTDDIRDSIIQVCPLGINRYSKKFILEYLEFEESDFFCQNIRREKIICPQADERISIAVREILEKLAYDKLYVANLSFMDVPLYSRMKPKEGMELVNGAVIQGMNDARTPCKLIINTSGHTIPDTKRNVTELMQIFFHPDFTKENRIARIIDKIMNRYSVDVLLTGLYIEHTDTSEITIRPLVILRYDKKIVTKNLKFRRSELYCQDPLSNKRVLCRDAYDEIAHAVQGLLEKL